MSTAVAAWGTAPQPDDAWSSAPSNAGFGGVSASNVNDNWGVDNTIAEDLGMNAKASNSYDQTDTGPYREGENSGYGEAQDEKCFGCGEMGHRRAECPNPQEITCRYCKKPGHLIKDCPDKPPMLCRNCGEEGHMANNCENAHKVERDHIADLEPEVAWEKLKQAASERDVDDAKEAIQEYVKAVDGKITYRELQEALIEHKINLWLIATERPLLKVFSNMDFQGNMGKKYSVSYRFSEAPARPLEREGWPSSRDEILSRLDDAGDPTNTGLSRCTNCNEVGHLTKNCPEEKVERLDQPKISCYNCGGDGHRVRDCPEPRVDKFACKNCGKSGHKIADCEEPPNLDNVECRKCNEMGHFAKDCPQGGSQACRNCGQEGHISRECDQPRNMDNVTCRNCEKTGHFSRDCPEPKDWSKVKCSNCEEFGHTKVRCKKPPVESEDFGGEVFDNHPGVDAGFDQNSGAGTGDNWGATPVDTGGW